MPSQKLYIDDLQLLLQVEDLYIEIEGIIGLFRYTERTLTDKFDFLRAPIQDMASQNKKCEVERKLQIEASMPRSSPWPVETKKHTAELNATALEVQHKNGDIAIKAQRIQELEQTRAATALEVQHKNGDIAIKDQRIQELEQTLHECKVKAAETERWC